jgi:hypothetical protein
MDDDGFKRLVSQIRPGMRIIFGTHKKTDPVSPAQRTKETLD